MTASSEVWTVILLGAVMFYGAVARGPLHVDTESQRTWMLLIISSAFMFMAAMAFF